MHLRLFLSLFFALGLILLGQGLSGKTGTSGTSGTSGSSAAFTPSTIAGLVFWLDSSDAATLAQDEAGTTPAVADNAPVARWADKSGSGWHMLSPNGVAGGNDTNRPALKTAIINGKPVIRTNGTISFMRRITTISITGDDLTVFAVTRRVAFVDANEALLSIASSASNDFDNVEGTVIGHSVSSTDISDSRDDVILSDLTHPSNGTSFIYSSKYDGTNQIGYLNGVAGTPVACAGSFSSEKISLGFRNSAASISNPNNRDYAEILIYDSDLSDANREAVESYLAAKWGLTLP
jgi:hypothetical protein